VVTTLGSLRANGLQVNGKVKHPRKEVAAAPAAVESAGDVQVETSVCSSHPIRVACSSRGS
jgi:hypothetical protein